MTRYWQLTNEQVFHCLHLAYVLSAPTQCGAAIAVLSHAVSRVLMTCRWNQEEVDVMKRGNDGRRWLNILFSSANYLFMWGLWFNALFACVLNPLTAPSCKISGLKRAHIHACIQHIWWSYNEPTFNTVHFDKVLAGVHANGENAWLISSLALLLVVFRETVQQAWQWKG